MAEKEKKKYRGIRRLDRTSFLVMLSLALFFGGQAAWLPLWGKPHEPILYLNPGEMVPVIIVLVIAGVVCGYSAFAFSRLSRMP